MISDSFVDMHIRFSLILFIAILSLSSLAQDTSTLDTKNQRHIEVAMRTIGHEVMMAHGDSTSRVLPIEQEHDLYRIRFATEFRFDGIKLIKAIDDVVQRTELATHYLVEMQDCETEEIIFSYEVNGRPDMTTIPCGQREQPVICYNLLFTIMDNETVMVSNSINGSSPDELAAADSGAYGIFLLAIPLIFLLGFALYINRNKSTPSTDSNIIEIGNYQFDPRNMLLSLADNKVELTSKESDLLALLRSSANTTVERDDILRHVWGDKGDYVGRTLDVFISKLRKKLEGDPAVKIANIRGVGYRLVLN